MIAHVVAWLHARRVWRILAAVVVGAVAVLWVWLRHRATSRIDADQRADDRVVELAEDVVIANSQAAQEIAAVRAKDLDRRAEVIAAATDPDRAQRLARLARLMKRNNKGD